MSGHKRPPMTVKEAAEYLRLKPDKIRQLVKRNLIRRSNALPGKWLLDGDDVETFLERTC